MLSLAARMVDGDRHCAYSVSLIRDERIDRGRGVLSKFVRRQLRHFGLYLVDRRLLPELSSEW